MTATPPGGGGGIGGLLAQVFNFIGDKPWKAAVIFVAFVVGGIGWTLWEKRDEIMEAFLTPSATELKIADIPDALELLTKETDADIVQIWSVDLASNSQSFVAARRSNGERPVIPSPRRLPIIVTVSDLRALINVLEGQPVCVDLSPLGSPLARRLAERGMKRGCAIPIPPNPDFFVGVIYLAWQIAADPASEKVAVGTARDVAKRLSTR